MNNKVYHKKSSGMIGVPKHGKKKLDYFRIFDVQINPMFEHETLLAEDGSPLLVESMVTQIYARFHSEKDIAKLTEREVIQQFGGFQARVFEYDRTDLTKDEVIAMFLKDKTKKANNGDQIQLGDAVEKI